MPSRQSMDFTVRMRLTGSYLSFMKEITKMEMDSNIRIMTTMNQKATRISSMIALLKCSNSLTAMVPSGKEIPDFY
ncbi:predicted protein [Sclerotinia sclerotiorum 1980 UF-70]|uniref:Uncharacterized protein n=1 Tax=Sclerotinia sclerotiorum (strain ATCC 18683 / 1980 / Ss-1) TaxID=665079 RepID=A7EQ86_SCLS1|nr:predicted protein [Sclerotinia sclerotiorum 1980 UF-70]EDO05002.1 predicted protein [Sclerotinia sclerotiorum 1980 UF-70]